MITMEELQGYPVADDKEIRDAHNKAVSLIEHNVDEFFDCFPGANSENDFYRQTENTDWTEGFWTGELWLAYESNKDDKLKEAALCQVDNFLYRIEHHINTDHHDMGFLYSPSCVAAYKLTGSEVGKRAALLAADNLMKRFHEKGQFFQAWGKMDDKDNYRLIIDCLMNMPLLFWASKVTGDKKYEEKAQAHIKTAMENIVRDDNSTYHTYFFDMETGKQEVPFKYDTIEFVGEHEMSVTNDTNRYVVDMATGRVIYKGDKSMNVKTFLGDTYTWVYNKDGNYKILSLDGTVTETPVMKDISGTGSFSHGYSPVKIKGKWGIINSKGELVVQPTYDEITIL